MTQIKQIVREIAHRNYNTRSEFIYESLLRLDVLSAHGKFMLFDQRDEERRIIACSTSILIEAKKKISSRDMR